MGDGEGDHIPRTVRWLDNEAVKTVKLWRFQPGTKDGKPVPVRVAIE